MIETQTLVEIIRQLVGEDKRVLVCGASNLAVGRFLSNSASLSRTSLTMPRNFPDNLVERLTLHSVPLTRLGHPARILESLHSATLDYQTSHSSAGVIVKEMKEEMEEKFKKLREGKGRGGEGKAGAAGSRGGSGSGAGKGRMSGKERREMWEEVKELRKECVSCPSHFPVGRASIPHSMIKLNYTSSKISKTRRDSSEERHRPIKGRSGHLSRVSPMTIFSYPIPNSLAPWPVRV